MRLQGLSLAWFRESDWPAWRAMDPTFQLAFEVWRARMDGVFEHYQNAGVPVVKIVIRPDEFLAWSSTNGAGVGSDARAAFAAFKAMELDNSEGKH